MTSRRARLTALVVMLPWALAGCRLFNRPNPQLPPELRRDGPTAAAAATRSPGAETGEPPAAAPPAADAAPDGATQPAVPQPAPPVPRAGETVALPEAPPPGEGKSGRLLIEPLSQPPDSGLTPLPDDPEFRRALRKWDQGPVRYIILKEEQDLFRSLQTDEDRLRFIQDFWARRDRNRDTADNEYRLEFWRRVAESERRFIDALEPGWKTDRGRVWILLGPPDETDDFRVRRSGSGVIRWIYRNRPNIMLQPNFIVAFRQNFSGEWELSNDPRDFDPVFRDMQINIEPVPLSAGIQSLLPQPQEFRLPATDALSLYLDLGQATAPPELFRSDDREARVETREVFGAMDVRTAFEFLGPGPGGSVRTGVVVGILKGSLVSETDEDEADANLNIDLSLYSSDTETPDAVVRIPSGFGPSRENYVAPLARRLLFRTEVSLQPGSYLAVYRILDKTSGQAAQARETFTVPDRFGAELHVSTIVLSQRLAEVDPAVERPDAFTLGRFRVVPNLDATYRNGDTFAFYYQVNGASFDPRTGRRRLDVEYSFAVQQGSDWLSLGEPLIYRDQVNPQAWSVPLRDWPPAAYRLTVRVTDVVSGATTSNQAFFRVLPGA